MASNEAGVLTGLQEETEGQGPVTDYDSKTVMMAAERHDNIEITEVIDLIEEPSHLPENVSVVKRTDTFYGPELLVHSSKDGTDYNYLLTAPGPGTHLCLWAGNISEESGKRKAWYPAAEVKATLAAEQPPYEKCTHCGELIRTIHHEREAVLGQCSRA